MEYINSEIISKFKRMDDKDEAVKILSELNACKKRDIIKILGQVYWDGKEEEEKRIEETRKKIPWREVREELKNGTDPEILAERYDTTVQVIKMVTTRYYQGEK